MIYLDNAATTRLRPEVFAAMRPYFEEAYGNASADYAFAKSARDAVERARRTAAELLGAKPEEIYFTSGGSESDNWALTAAAYAYREKGSHMITSGIEHHAVLNTCAFLERQGCEVTRLEVDRDGMVDPDELEAAIRPSTILISVMAANNEIGTVEPVRAIGAAARRHGVLFHTDAVQAYGQIRINVDESGIDMLSASGHKFGGPKGVGILYVREGVELGAFIHGGGQERGLRAGTLNVPGIVGFGMAAELAAAGLEQRAARVAELRDHLIGRVLSEIWHSRLNGPGDARLPNNASFCFEGVEGEAVLFLLDQRGICASRGSACTAGAADPSHVLLAVGVPRELAYGALRFTLSDETTREEIDETVEVLKEVIAQHRLALGKEVW